MNIKQAEERSGISGQNIRFYEKQGLLHPDRNPINSYRNYSEEDIHTLKQIRLLRMLDMPLEEIKCVLSGQQSIAAAVSLQKEKLELRQEQLQAAIRLCDHLAGISNFQSVDLDQTLSEMDNAPEGSFFSCWLEDYHRVAKAARQRSFCFTPDAPVTNAREFTNALLAYANENHLNLVITHESMYPIFTIDGVEYAAFRNYHRIGTIGFSAPLVVITCEMTHPDILDIPIDPKRQKGIQILRKLRPFLILLLMFPVFSLPYFPNGIRQVIGWLYIAALAAGAGFILWKVLKNNSK